MFSRRNPKVLILLQISAMTGLLLSCSGGKERHQMNAPLNQYGYYYRADWEGKIFPGSPKPTQDFRCTVKTITTVPGSLLYTQYKYLKNPICRRLKKPPKKTEP